MLRRICDYDDGFLDCGTCYLCWSVEQLCAIYLARTRYAKEGSCFLGRIRRGRRAEEGKVREVFLGPATELLHIQVTAQGAKGTYACAPSLNAMNERLTHPLSSAGSCPSGTPNQVSISGPLPQTVLVFVVCEVWKAVIYLA